MTLLRIHASDDPERMTEIHDFPEVQRVLGEQGVRIERWSAEWEPHNGLIGDCAPEEILEAYTREIESMKRQGGYTTADVVTMKPDAANKTAMREKFLEEHTHTGDEVRFFVNGSGLFYVHAGAQVFALLCTRGDLVVVPSGVTHWFDMGPEPEFTCIRIFTNTAGWEANFTGDPIVRKFPLYEPGYAPAR